MNGLHYVALGANLPAQGGVSPIATCIWAANRLMAVAGVEAACRSRWFSSAPVPASGQPRYINGIVRLSGKLDPAALLAACQAIEAAAGRVRSVPDAARTLDVDLIDMAGLVRSGADPILPHPRAHLRGFVLLPLRDVAPGWVHPVFKVGIGALIAGLPAQDIVPAG